LSWAAGNGRKEVVSVLLEDEFVCKHCPDKQGRTPLFWAVGNGHMEVVKLMVSNDYEGLTIVDEDGLTALAWASINEQELTWKMLVAEITPGVNTKLPAGMLSTALPWVAMHGGELAVLSLLTYDETGGFVDAAVRRLGESSTDSDLSFLPSLVLREGMTRGEVWSLIMSMAAFRGLSDLLGSLLQKDPPSETSSLVTSATGWKLTDHSTPRVARRTLPSIPAPSSTHLWQSCLLFAVRNRYDDVVKMLLNDPRLDPKDEGRTLLSFAV